MRKSTGICLLALAICVETQYAMASDAARLKLELRPIDISRVGQSMPDSSAVVDLDGDGVVEILTSMQNSDKHPEVLLYKRKSDGDWDCTKIGAAMEKEEIEWVAAGRPFPGDSRVCIAASVQHKKDGLVVFRLREPGLSPFDTANWEKGVAKGYAGQGLAFRDLDGDNVDELVYATQAGNELGVLKVKEQGDPMNKSGWEDHVIDAQNNRSWWWLDGKFYDLNDNGLKHDFFVSTRRYGGKDLGMWTVIQTKPNDLSSYRVEKIYNGDAMNFDTGFFFSNNRNRKPDIVMMSKDNRKVFLMDGRNEYATTPVPFVGRPWNVKILPFLAPSGSRDSFVLATAQSPSLFWSYQWRDGAYEMRMETGYPGDYGHPMDGTFTIADVDGDGEDECVVPDSARSTRSKGLAYLKAVPAGEGGDEPHARFELDKEKR